MLNPQGGNNPYEWRLNFKDDDNFQLAKASMHREVITRLESDHLDLTMVERPWLEAYVSEIIGGSAPVQGLALSRRELDRLAWEIVDEIIGYGPLESLLKDERVSDILINGSGHIFTDIGGRLRETGMRFIDDEHVLRVVRRMLAPIARRLDESSPMVDARLADGSRLNAIIPPLALDGPVVSIRKFRRDMLGSTDLLTQHTVDSTMLDFLRKAVQARANILISGGTGTGKTTLLNILSRFINPQERVVTIEDAAELKLGHEHVVRLESRPPNAEGRLEVRARELVRNALRMRPDRIVLGEVRGDEVLDLLQAMNTGHDGSMSTVHANSSQDALVRLEMLGGLAGFSGSEQTLREMIAAAIDVIVHVVRLPDGHRVVSSVREMLTTREGRYVTSELISYDRVGRRFIHHSAKPEGPKFMNIDSLLSDNY